MNELIKVNYDNADQQIHRLETQCMQLEAKVEQDKPKVLFADSVATAKTSILIGELAKILRSKPQQARETPSSLLVVENGKLVE